MTNGHNQDEPGRLDRIEAIMEALATRKADIETDLSQLVKAQIVFGDEVSKAFKAADARMTRFETGLAEATDKLNALIDLMDRHLREHGEGKA
jgi:hypothetical protein